MFTLSPWNLKLFDPMAWNQIVCRFENSLWNRKLNSATFDSSICFSFSSTPIESSSSVLKNVSGFDRKTDESSDFVSAESGRFSSNDLNWKYSFVQKLHFSTERTRRVSTLRFPVRSFWNEISKWKSSSRQKFSYLVSDDSEISAIVVSDSPGFSVILRRKRIFFETGKLFCSNNFLTDLSSFANFHLFDFKTRKVRSKNREKWKSLERTWSPLDSKRFDQFFWKKTEKIFHEKISSPKNSHRFSSSSEASSKLSAAILKQKKKNENLGKKHFSRKNQTRFRSTSELNERRFLHELFLRKLKCFVDKRRLCRWSIEPFVRVILSFHHRRHFPLVGC